MEETLERYCQILVPRLPDGSIGVVTTVRQELWKLDRIIWWHDNIGHCRQDVTNTDSVSDSTFLSLMGEYHHDLLSSLDKCGSNCMTLGDYHDQLGMKTILVWHYCLIGLLLWTIWQQCTIVLGPEQWSAGGRRLSWPQHWQHCHSMATVSPYQPFIQHISWQQTSH